MKGQKRIFYVGGLLLLIFIGVSILTFRYSNNLIQDGYLASEGNAAKDFAILTASNIHLTNAQVEQLKEYSYEDLQKSEENKSLYQMLNTDNFTSKVDYAYVMIHLDKEEVKYQVSEENQSLFDAPVGTDLDIMWLLDVTLTEEGADASVTDSVASDDDIQRYSYYIDEDALIFGEAPTYIFNSSEWGDHICGYAPLHSEEGTYIGVVGVELQTTNFIQYCNRAIGALALLAIVSTLTLTLVFVYLYVKYRKMQYEKIYTDSLTGIYNRSYYNNQFIKRLSSLHKGESHFALLIADIDWFKKVNDTFGHETGDQVLIEISQLLQEAFGRTHVVRFGGEEFVAGIWIHQIDDLHQQLDDLYNKIQNRKFSDQQITLSMSLGCCYCAKQELTGWLLSGMLKAADQKLYECKENGRKQYRMIPYEETEHAELGQ